MYILIKDWLDYGHAINTAAHSGMVGYIKWQDSDEVKEWLQDSYRKVTCRVTEKEFEKAKQYDDWEIVTELAYDKKEVALVFKPRVEYPKFFKFLKLYR